VAIDYARSMTAYKVGAEGGYAHSQWQVGSMYCNGEGVDVDYAQALPWIEKAAAQDEPNAVGQLGVMYANGIAVISSYRRAREYYARATELDCSMAVKHMQDLNMQDLTTKLQQVTSQRSIHTAPSSSLVRDLTLPHLPALSPYTRRSPPSWTSGWKSTARAGRT
jgi:hypothetical protein